MTEREIQVVQELNSTDVLAYKYKDAARVLGLSYGSLRNEMIRDEIHPLTGWKLISRDELIRWVREREHKPVPRTRAKRIDVRVPDGVALTE